MRKVVREASGRVVRPSTSEIRHEVTKVAKDPSHPPRDDFELGIYVALQWALGERKTLQRP